MQSHLHVVEVFKVHPSQKKVAIKSTGTHYKNPFYVNYIIKYGICLSEKGTRHQIRSASYTSPHLVDWMLGIQLTLTDHRSHLLYHCKHSCMSCNILKTYLTHVKNEYSLNIFDES